MESLPRAPSGGALSFATVRRQTATRRAVRGSAQPPPGKANSHDASDATVPILEVAQGDPVGLRERRLTWSELLQRVFREDVLRCKRCGGRAEIISAITQPKVVEAILICLGHTTRAPPIAPARQTPFDL